MERPPSLSSFFLFHFRDSDFFFRIWKWNLSIFTDLSFFGRQSLVKTSFSISLFILKPSQIYLSNRWQHYNCFSIGSNKPEHGDKPTTLRFLVFVLEIGQFRPFLISFPKPKTRFYKRDKNLVFGFGNEIREGLISQTR